MAPESLPDPLRVTLDIAHILDRLSVPYVAAGSLASSLHGEPRSTDDVDFVADLRGGGAGERGGSAAALVRALGQAWYVSEDAVREAVARGTAFNAVHLATGVKVDFFVVGRDAFDRHRVATGQPVQLGDRPDTIVRMDTAEHTVVRKLEWFRRGGERSDRQWRDVVGVLRAQGSRLDRQELAVWASRLSVADLLKRALAEVGN